MRKIIVLLSLMGSLFFLGCGTSENHSVQNGNDVEKPNDDISDISPKTIDPLCRVKEKIRGAWFEENVEYQGDVFYEMSFTFRADGFFNVQAHKESNPDPFGLDGQYQIVSPTSIEIKYKPFGQQKEISDKFEYEFSESGLLLTESKGFRHILTRGSEPLEEIVNPSDTIDGICTPEDISNISLDTVDWCLEKDIYGEWYAPFVPQKNEIPITRIKFNVDQSSEIGLIRDTIIVETVNPIKTRFGYYFIDNDRVEIHYTETDASSNLPMVETYTIKYSPKHFIKLVADDGREIFLARNPRQTDSLLFEDTKDITRINDGICEGKQLQCSVDNIMNNVVGKWSLSPFYQDRLDDKIVSLWSGYNLSSFDFIEFLGDGSLQIHRDGGAEKPLYYSKPHQKDCYHCLDQQYFWVFEFSDDPKIKNNSDLSHNRSISIKLEVLENHLVLYLYSSNSVYHRLVLEKLDFTTTSDGQCH